MQAFLLETTGVDHSVIWSKRNPKNTYSTYQYWLCNSHINSIFVKNVNRKVFESINGEYKKNALKPWRNAFQAIYLKMAQNGLLAPKFSDYNVYFYPHIISPSEKLILGGNAKIRLINIAERQVFVILKKGFDKKYIDKELHIRDTYQFLSTTKVLDRSMGGGWYCENYVEGVPLNILGYEKRSIIINSILNEMVRIYEKTKIRDRTSVYLQSLESSTMKYIKELSIDTQIEKRVVLSIKMILSLLIYSIDSEIDIVYCHGDLHMGNILSDGNNYWIMDWEHSGRMNISYDLITLLLGSRVGKNYPKRFLRLYNNINDYHVINFSRCSNVNWQNKDVRKKHLLIYLLEDLKNGIHDLVDKPYCNIESLIEIKVSQIEKIIRYF